MSQVVFVLTLRFDVYEMTKFVGDQPIVSTLFPDWRVAADAILRAGRSALAKVNRRLICYFLQRNSGIAAVSTVYCDGNTELVGGHFQCWGLLYGSENRITRAS